MSIDIEFIHDIYIIVDTYETVVDPVISRKNWLHEKETRAVSVHYFNHKKNNSNLEPLS